jgi:hypothetical protein
VEFLASPIDTYVPIFDAITRHINFKDLGNIRASSRDLKGGYQKVKDTQWKINTAFQKFVGKPENFRSKLHNRSCVMTGLFALNFLDRKRVSNKLDLIVSCSPRGDRVMDYLVTEEKYFVESIEETPQSSDDVMLKFFKVRTLYRLGNYHVGIVLHHIFKTSNPILHILRGRRLHYSSLEINHGHDGIRALRRLDMSVKQVLPPS